MTLLQVDRGVDTGPVLAHFRLKPTPSESHVITEHRAVLDHLDEIRGVLLAVAAQKATTIDTTGRRSATWGQPWLSAFLRLRRERQPAASALMYHDIVSRGEENSSGFPGRDAARYKITHEAFEEHLEAVDRVFGAIHAQPVLTFDDGGIGAMKAADSLDRRGLKGHFFVTANYIGTRGFVTVADIRDLQQRGHIVGSHSCSHPLRMSRCAKRQLEYEWVRSREVISDVLGEPVVAASVPGGDYAPSVAAAAAKAGFSTLFTSEPTIRWRTIDGLLVRGRFTVRSWTTAANAAELALGRWAARVPQAVAWDARKVAKWVAGEHYLPLRRWLLGSASDVRWGDEETLLTSAADQNDVG
jgi:peptidoglycan/xylan/chitin deacetylase (PgdA/CDA1 family)